MKRLVTVLDILLVVSTAIFMFGVYGMVWGDFLFWIKISATGIYSVFTIRFINIGIERYNKSKLISKVTDDIITALAEVRQERTVTPTEDEKTWYEKKLDELRAKNNKLQEDFLYRENIARDYAEKFDENKSFEDPSLLDLAPSICSMYFDSKNRLNSIDDATSSYKQIEKKYSALRRNERNLKTFLKNLEKELSDNEHLEGMSPIARHKYEKAKQKQFYVDKNQPLKNNNLYVDIKTPKKKSAPKTKNPKSTKNTKK